MLSLNSEITKKGWECLARHNFYAHAKAVKGINGESLVVITIPFSSLHAQGKSAGSIAQSVVGDLTS